MVRGQNILVAGGSGLIGANLTKRLVEMGAYVRSTYFSNRPCFTSANYERYDFTQFEDCLKATKDMQGIFICAVRSLDAQTMKENPTAWILPNLKIYAGLLEAAKVNGVEKTIFISSSTVYPKASYPIREEELDCNKPPYDLYRGVGWLNRYIEQLCQFYYQVYGMKIGIIRPTSIYGPHDKFEGDNSNVVPALIQRALRKENPYVVWGDGSAVRDFVYVDDFVDALLQLFDRYCVCDPLNYASGLGITIREAVRVILDVCGHPVEPQYDETKPNAIPYRVLNAAKYQSIFGQKKLIPFEAGIQKTVDWYRATL